MAGDNHIAIVCFVEPLSPYSGFTVGLNISVSIVRPGNTDDDLTDESKWKSRLPWNWRSISGAYYTVQPAAAGTTQPVPVPVEVVPPEPEPNVMKMAAMFEDAYDTAWQNADPLKRPKNRLLYNPLDPRKDLPSYPDPANPVNLRYVTDRRLYAWLAGLSTENAVIQRNLNLSRLVKLPDVAGQTGNLYVVPQLSGVPGFPKIGAPEALVQPPPPANGGWDGKPALWTYGGTGGQVIAYVQPCPIKPPPVTPASLIDPGTYWIRAKDAPNLEADPGLLTDLPNQVVNTFYLADLIHTAFQEARLADGDLPRWREAFYASLRDRVPTGVPASAPNNITSSSLRTQILDAVANTWQAPAGGAGVFAPMDSAAASVLVGNAIDNWNNTLDSDTWRTQVLVPIAGRFNVAMGGDSRAALNDEMSAWLKLLDQQDRVNAIFGAQWNAALMQFGAVQSADLKLPKATGTFGVYFPDVALSGHPEGSYYLTLKDNKRTLEVNYCIDGSVIFILYSADGKVLALNQAGKIGNKLGLFLEFTLTGSQAVFSRLSYKNGNWQPVEFEPVSLQFAAPLSALIDRGSFSQAPSSGTVRFTSWDGAKWVDAWTASGILNQKALAGNFKDILIAASVEWPYDALKYAGEDDPFDALRNAHKKERENYLQGRLGQPGPAQHDPAHPDEFNAYSMLRPPVGAAAGKPVYDAALKQKLPFTIDPPVSVPASGPQPLVVDMLLASTTAQQTYDPNDYMLKFSGVGVLMRVQPRATPRSSNTYLPWCCLNLAQVYLGSGDSAQRLDSIGPIPYRISYSAGLKQAIVMYNAQSLIAPSDLNRLANPNDDLKGDQQFLQPQGDLSGLVPAIRYGGISLDDDHPTTKPYLGWCNFPSLKYGRNLQVLAFAIANSGALPKELAAAGTPTRICLPGQFTTEGSQADFFKPYIHTFAYMRKVPVRAPRLVQRSGAENRLPLLPDDAQSKDVVLLDSEMQRDAQRGPDARNVYFGPAVPTPGRTGLLNLPAEGWRIWIDAVHQLAGTSFLLDIGEPDNPPAISLRFDRTSGGVRATCLTAGGHPTETFPVARGLYYDIDIRQHPDTLTVVVQPAAGIFLPRNPENARKSLDIQLPAEAILNAAVSLTTSSNDLLRYRRPQVEFAASTNSAPPAAMASSTPVALLGPWVDKLQFELSPPDIDLQTWDRWTDFKAPESRHLNRDVIWTNWYLQSRNPSPDLRVRSIDDPAVAGYLIEVVPIHTNKLEPVPAVAEQWYDRSLFHYAVDAPYDYWAQVESPPVTLTAELLPAQNGALSRKFRLVLNDAPGGSNPPGNDRKAAKGKSSPAGPPFKCDLSAGGIYELRVYAGVPAEEFAPENVDPTTSSGRFAPRLKRGLRTREEGRKKYVLFAPFRIRFEVAMHPADLLPDMPGLTSKETAADRILSILLGSIQPQFATDTEYVSARLLKPIAYDASTPEGYLWEHWWPYMRDVQLLMREWRWLGRPEHPDRPFPYDAFDDRGLAKPADGRRIVQWEAGAFANRTLDDLRNEKKRIGCYAPDLALFSEDRTPQHQTLYHQFAVQVYSRYNSRLQQFPVTYTGTQPKEWVRQFVKCRYPLRRNEKNDPVEVPAPAVRMIIPLTQSAEWTESGTNRAGRGPGVLVVVDEEWGATGGFAEKLGVELVSTSNEEIRSFKNLQELAPDPIRTAETYQCRVAFSPSDIEGPIGHTFDPPAEKPYYRACSFEVRLPLEIELQALPAPFARMRFYRYLDEAGCVTPPGFDAEKLKSKYSDPFWAQFQPDSNTYAGLHGSLTIIELLDTRNSRTIRVPRLRFYEKDPAQRYEFRIDPKTCGLLAAVTRRITDAFGRPGRERFLGLFRLSQEDCTLFLPIAPCPGPFDEPGETIVRIMESWVVPDRHDVTGEDTQEFYGLFNLPARDFPPAAKDSVLDGCRPDGLEIVLRPSPPLSVQCPHPEGRK